MSVVQFYTGDTDLKRFGKQSEHKIFPCDESLSKKIDLYNEELTLKEMSIPQTNSIIAFNRTSRLAFISEGEVLLGGYMDRIVINSMIIPSFSAAVIDVIPVMTKFDTTSIPFNTYGLIIPFHTWKFISEDMAKYRYDRKRFLRDGLMLSDSEFPGWQKGLTSKKIKSFVPFTEYDGTQEIFPFDYQFEEIIESPLDYDFYDFEQKWGCRPHQSMETTMIGMPDFRDGFFDNLKDYFKKMRKPLPEETSNNRHITRYNHPNFLTAKVNDSILGLKKTLLPEAEMCSFTNIHGIMKSRRHAYLKAFNAHRDANGMAVFINGLLYSIRIMGCRGLYENYFRSVIGSLIYSLDNVTAPIVEDDVMIEKVWKAIDGLDKMIADKSTYREGAKEVRYLTDESVGVRYEYRGKFILFNYLNFDVFGYIKVMDENSKNKS